MRLGRSVVCFAVALLLVGCVRYQLVANDEKVTVGNGFRVTPGIAWSMSQEGGAYVWTVDGPSLEQLRFVPGVGNGAPLLPPARGTEANGMPLFEETMTLIEVADLVEATMARQGCHQFVKRNLKPAPFGGLEGFRFDFNFVSKEGLEYRGLAAGAIKGGRLYLVMYTGTTIHYYDKHAAAVERICSNIEVL